MIRRIEFERVSFAYPGGGEVFRDVSFALPEDPVTWVRARGDRGRSTLLRLIGAMLEPTAGRVLVDGRDPAAMTFAEGVATRLGFGFGFDAGGLISNRSLAENLALPLLYHRLLGRVDALRRVDDLTRRFGLDEVADLRPHDVTGSQRKLTCVLRAFVHEPSVVLLDEPLTGLKRADIDELTAFVREGFARRGLGRVVITGENPLLAEPFGAAHLNLTRDRVWSERTRAS